ncbi:hypothetical protein EXS56_01935 [Candidatus Kaiserbacteria bacterium]|nr:hypothetical protein [Candidatus Kaiserbacteria bacterium]
MGLEKSGGSEKIPNPLGLTSKVLAGWIAMHSVTDLPAHAAEIPKGTPWSQGLTMMQEDSNTKPYEVGGLVVARGNGKHEWRTWAKGEEAKDEKSAPSIATPMKAIAENLKTVTGKGDYLCIIHSHIRPKVLGLRITSTPPSPGDMFSTVMAAASPHIPANAVHKIKHGVVDNLGMWTYGLAETPQLLRQRIKTQGDLENYVRENRPKYNAAMQAGLEWAVYVGQLETTSAFSTLSDAEKVNQLRSSRKYREFQKDYLNAGLIVKYATREEAAAAPPCGDEVGK